MTTLTQTERRNVGAAVRVIADKGHDVLNGCDYGNLTAAANAAHQIKLHAQKALTQIRKAQRRQKKGWV